MKSKKLNFKLFTFFLVFVAANFSANSQIAYDHITNKAVSVGSYGRVGVDWSFDHGIIYSIYHLSNFLHYKKLLILQNYNI